MESPKNKVETTRRELVNKVLERLADEHQEVINRREESSSRGRSGEAYQRPDDLPEEQDQLDPTTIGIKNT